ncbi:hypothetical protein, partial [Nocardia farcinica]|uniref:hypothetical protein n=1 Tax=Nocardia farcinica TaxID=37329 RepID=UPI00245440CA
CCGFVVLLNFFKQLIVQYYSIFTTPPHCGRLAADRNLGHSRKWLWFTSERNRFRFSRPDNEKAPYRFVLVEGF